MLEIAPATTGWTHGLAKGAVSFHQQCGPPENVAIPDCRDFSPQGSKCCEKNQLYLGKVPARPSRKINGGETFSDQAPHFGLSKTASETLETQIFPCCASTKTKKIDSYHFICHPFFCDPLSSLCSGIFASAHDTPSGAPSSLQGFRWKWNSSLYLSQQRWSWVRSSTPS